MYSFHVFFSTCVCVDEHSRNDAKILGHMYIFISAVRFTNESLHSFFLIQLDWERVKLSRKDTLAGLDDPGHKPLFTTVFCLLFLLRSCTPLWTTLQSLMSSFGSLLRIGAKGTVRVTARVG